jgi:hypothetical protein
VGKTYGIKGRCYWEHPWETHWETSEHIENSLGTLKEHVGNKGKMKKKTRHFECMLSLPLAA